MASFSLGEGNKRSSLRSLRQVNIIHKAPRTGPQRMVAVRLCHLVVAIRASPGTVVRPKLLLPEKLHACGPIYQIFTQRQLGPNTML